MKLSYKISLSIYITICVLVLSNTEERFNVSLYMSFLFVYMLIIQHIQQPMCLYKHAIDIIAYLYYREYALMIMMPYQMFELIWHYSEYTRINSPNPQAPF